MSTFVVCWVVMFGLFLALTEKVSPDELIAGAGSAAAAAAVAVVAVRAFAPPRPPRFLVRLRWLPVDLLVDVARLVAATPRVPSGRVGTTTRARIDPEPASDASDRLAYAVLLASATPGSYVLAVSDDEGILRVHRVGPAGRIVEGVLS